MVPSFPHSVPRGGGCATAAIVANLFFLRHHPFLSKAPFVTLLSNASANSISAATTSAAVANSVSASIVPQPSSLNPNPRIFYGPSLRKGTPSPNPTLFSEEEGTEEEEEEEEGAIFDESLFTRVFEIAAIRVPSEQCFALESQLRGHLLNWPRIRNVARVPGDDVDPVLQKLLDNGTNSEEHGDGVDHEGNLKSLSRRLYGKAVGDGERLSPVLYRDKLAKTFNSRGFVKFRNLAKLSRPKKKKKKTTTKRGEEEGSGRGYRNCRGVGKNGPAMVEAVEDMEAVGDLKGLLGDEFKGGRNWRGPTRLLLLDEKYAHKGAREMPEAIKAVLSEGPTKSAMPNIEIVRCKLTLSYDYWQMNEVLEALLPDGMIVPSSFETVGHIAHLNLKDEHLPYKKLIAKVVLDKNSKKIHTVVNKMEAIHSDYRTMQLEVLAGNHSLVTRVVENGIRFQVDLAAVYWNSRLATERQRLVNCFTHKDIVCDVFSGVGPLAISAAKKVKRVYANDLNPYAVEYLERNCILNKLERKIQVFNMDGRRFIDALFASQNKNSITQVVMNLPNDAVEYLDAFRGIFGRKFNDRELTLPKLHVYGFSKARDPEFDFHERIRIGLSEVAVDVEMRRVRLVAPGKWMLCASFILPESVAFARTMRGESGDHILKASS